MTSMAKTIAHAEGPSGHNVEYLVKICDFMREELPPDIGDNHLYQLERLTLDCLARRGWWDLWLLADTFFRSFSMICAEDT